MSQRVYHPYDSILRVKRIVHNKYMTDGRRVISSSKDSRPCDSNSSVTTKVESLDRFRATFGYITNSITYLISIVE